MYVAQLLLPCWCPPPRQSPVPRFLDRGVATLTFSLGNQQPGQPWTSSHVLMRAHCVQDVALSSQHLRSAVSICLMHIRGEAPGPAPAAKAAGGPGAHSAAKQAAQGAGASAAARLPAAVACGFRQVMIRGVYGRVPFRNACDWLPVTHITQLTRAAAAWPRAGSPRQH